MARVRKHKAAKRDLTAQWVWYGENATVEIADRFLAAVDTTADMLALQPEAGTPLRLRGNRASDLRQFGVADGFDAIRLLYRPRPGGIDLVRVLHSKRDLARLLES